LIIPVTADFSYRKKKGRREYVRVTISQNREGALIASKHPRDGAGIITSLTESDGLGELAEDLTEVQPGTAIGFLPYAHLFS
jgi:molybdopterin molybdotransferase